MTRRVRIHYRFKTFDRCAGRVEVMDFGTDTVDWRGGFDTEEQLAAQLREVAHYLDVTRKREESGRTA